MCGADSVSGSGKRVAVVVIAGIRARDDNRRPPLAIRRDFYRITDDITLSARRCNTRSCATTADWQRTITSCDCRINEKKIYKKLPPLSALRNFLIRSRVGPINRRQLFSFLYVFFFSFARKIVYVFRVRRVYPIGKKKIVLRRLSH